MNLLQYAKEFGIYSFIRFGSEGKIAEMEEEGSWRLNVSELKYSRGYSLQADKLVLATGQLLDLFHPSIRWERRIQSPNFAPQRSQAAYRSEIPLI
jgi:cation diffusion facilitator CzcD-associated flavoprotein CzcO